MTFELSQEQEMLRQSVRAFLADKMPMDHTRRLMETEDGFERSDWRAMADQGFAAMHIPEEYGGAGFSMLELGIVIEELGRSLAVAPMLSSVVLSANLLMLAGSEDQKHEHLPAIAAGDATAAVAFVEPDGSWSVDRVRTTAKRDGDGYVIDGSKMYVLDGVTADVLLVAARDETDDVHFYVVAGDAAGVSRSSLETMDMTRKQASIDLDGVSVAGSARLPVSAAEIVDRWYDLAVTGLAFEQVGGAQMCMEMSVQYAKDRYQFGRPIGSFQAVKHTCADMLVSVEAARSAALYAGWAAAVGDNDLAIAAPLAKSVCGDAFFDIAADTIQVHGGIGFTWEHDAHLYFKRAKTSQLLFGDSAEWRTKLADRIGLQPAAS